MNEDIGEIVIVTDNGRQVYGIKHYDPVTKIMTIRVDPDYKVDATTSYAPPTWKQEKK